MKSPLRLTAPLLLLAALLSGCLNSTDSGGYDNSADIEFLEENAGREGVEVTDSGLQIRTILEGDGEFPEPGSVVKVDYTGKLVSGNVFDSSLTEDRDPFEFQVQVSSVIPGWTEGIQLMREGGVYELVIPAHLGYGNFPPSEIHPGATLIFEMELLEIL